MVFTVYYVFSMYQTFSGILVLPSFLQIVCIEILEGHAMTKSGHPLTDRIVRTPYKLK